MESQAFHGLEAYSGKHKPIQRLIAQALAVNAVQGEICTASRLIGSIGLIVTACHTAAFDCDVWSDIDKRGFRGFDPSKSREDTCWFVDGSVGEKWNYSPSDWTNSNGLSNECLRRAEASAQRKRRKYGEFFARKPCVNYVVYSEKAGEAVARRARVLARALKTVALAIDPNAGLIAHQMY